LQDIEATTILEEPQSSESSSSFPETRESNTALIEANTMADEQPR